MLLTSTLSSHSFCSFLCSIKEWSYYEDDFADDDREEQNSDSDFEYEDYSSKKKKGKGGKGGSGGGAKGNRVRAVPRGGFDRKTGAVT